MKKVRTLRWVITVRRDISSHVKKVAETANLMEYKEIQKLCHSGACGNTTWHGTLLGDILMANELIFIVEALLVDQNSPHSSRAVEAFNGDPPFR